MAPVHSLGPGNRVCLWTQGCQKKCPGCMSPDLQPFQGSVIDEVALAKMLEHLAAQSKCTGLTVSGGDPFEQAEALLKLLRQVRNTFDDILVYTGFELGEILSGRAGTCGTDCLNYIDVLIDGRYQRERNTADCVLRGSANQTIHYLTPGKAASYGEYLKKGRILECFSHDNKTIITGILNEEVP